SAACCWAGVSPGVPLKSMCDGSYAFTRLAAGTAAAGLLATVVVVPDALVPFTDEEPHPARIRAAAQAATAARRRGRGGMAGNASPDPGAPVPHRRDGIRRRLGPARRAPRWRCPRRYLPTSGGCHRSS